MVGEDVPVAENGGGAEAEHVEEVLDGLVLAAFERRDDLRRRAEPGDRAVVDVGVAVDRGEGEFLHLQGVHLPVQQVVGQEEAACDGEQGQILTVAHLLGDLEAVGAGGDDRRVGLDEGLLGVDGEPVGGLPDVADLGPRGHVDAVLCACGLDEGVRDHAVVDDVAVGGLQGQHRNVGVPALDDGGFDLGDLLAPDRFEFREQVAEALLVVPLFEFGDFVLADGQYHLGALAVHLAVPVDVLEVAGQQFGALLDVFGLLQGVVRLDVPEVQRLGVVRVVGVDRRYLRFLFE